MDLFKSRMVRRGLSVSERNLNLKKRSFKKWFDETLNKHDVIINDKPCQAVFQDHNQNNNDNLSDDKFMIVENDVDAKVGHYVIWEDKTWLTFGYENKTIRSHKQLKVKETNEIFRWINKDGEICNNGKGYRGHVKNQTLYTLGVNMSGNNLWIASAQMMVYLPYNEEINELTLGSRLFIGNNVYEIMFNDNVSRRGLSNFLLEQDMVNPEIDNVELRIADYHKHIDEEDNDDDENNDAQDTTVKVEGIDRVRIGATSTYMGIVSNENDEIPNAISKWSVIDENEAVNVVDQNSDSITIQVKSDFKKVGSVVTIVGSTEDGITGSKSINIISPY